MKKGLVMFEIHLRLSVRCGQNMRKKRKVLDILEETSCKGPEEQKVQEIDLRFMGLEV